MSDLTLEKIEAKQTEIVKLIDQFKQASLARRFTIPSVSIVLAAGEWYAGPVINEDGSVKHHVVVMKTDITKRLDFDATQALASELGGVAPTIQEGRLIVSHQYGRLGDASSIWTIEVYKENASCAWNVYLGDGGTGIGDRSFERCPVVVRRVNP